MRDFSSWTEINGFKQVEHSVGVVLEAEQGRGAINEILGFWSLIHVVAVTACCLDLSSLFPNSPIHRSLRVKPA